MKKFTKKSTNTASYLTLAFICLTMMGCATKPVQSNQTEQYEIYNPNCTRFSQHIPIHNRLNSVEQQEKLDLAKSCKFSTP